MHSALFKIFPFQAGAPTPQLEFVLHRRAVTVRGSTLHEWPPSSTNVTMLPANVVRRWLFEKWIV
jgi:hypothetical protein